MRPAYHPHPRHFYEDKSGTMHLCQKWEIPESVYWEFLEVLPPVGYKNGAFYMSEMLTENITSKYSQEGDKYFHEYARLPGRLWAEIAA